MKTDKDHYIPQAYLKRFFNSSRIFYIWDREKNVIHKGYPGSSMFIRGHLTSNKYGKIIDKYFQKYETNISPIINKICSHYDTLKISDWEFVLLSGFIESQYIRVPKIADINNDIIIDLLKYILPNTGRIHNIRDLFAIMNWSIYKTSTLPFVTTDSPVIIFDRNVVQDSQILQRESLNDFMHKKDVVVCFPLDPYNLLYMKHFIEMPTTKDELVTLTYENIQSELVDDINITLMVEFSSKYVLCGDLPYIKRLSNGAEYINK